MIILQTGVPGSGKTASIVAMLLDDETYTHFTDRDGVKKQRPLFVNGIDELQIEHQLLTDEQIKEQPLQDFLPYGSLIVIDEAQRLMGNRPAASRVPAFIEGLATHRHHGLDVVLITQHPSFVDPFVRKLVQRHMHISIKPVGRKLYEWNECIDNPEAKMNIDKAIERQFIVPKKSIGLYKSAEVHTKPSRRIPRSMVFFAILLPVVIFFAVHVFNRMSSRYGGESQESMNAVAASTPLPQFTANGQYHQSGYTPNQSLTPQMYVPTLSEKPESKPLYDSIRQVRQYERVAGCIDGGKTGCTCYSDQATKLREITQELCKRYVHDGLPFDPFREPMHTDNVDNATATQSEMQAITSISSVQQMGGQSLPSLAQGNSDVVANIQ